MIEVKRRNNETPAAMLFRFTKKIRQSGIMKETRHRRFHSRTENKRKRAASAKYKAGKAKEISDLRKMGAF